MFSRFEKRGNRDGSDLERLRGGDATLQEIAVTERNAAADPQLMIRMCQKKLINAKCALILAPDPTDYLKTTFPPEVAEAFDFVNQALVVLKRLVPVLSTSKAEKPVSETSPLYTSTANITDIELTRPNMRKRGEVVSELVQKIAGLEIDLILAQALCEDPKITKVPFRFARAVRFLLPALDKAAIRSQLIDLLLKMDMSAAFSKSEKDQLIKDLSVSGEVDMRYDGPHPPLITKLINFAQYNARGRLVYPESAAETFTEFMQMKKLQAAVKVSVAQSRDLEAEFGRGICEACCAADNYLALCATTIFSVLRQKTQGIVQNSFLYILMRNLSPLIGFDWQKISQQRFLSDRIRHQFCGVFEEHYLIQHRGARLEL
jgi:hypothetical protein